jgi:hypothetical protein
LRHDERTSYQLPPGTASIFVRSNSHAAKQRTCRKCRSEPGCMPWRLNSISISVWSEVTNSLQTEHTTRVPGPPNVRSGRRLGSLPRRIAARAISRSTGSSSSILARLWVGQDTRCRIAARHFYT